MKSMWFLSCALSFFLSSFILGGASCPVWRQLFEDCTDEGRGSASSHVSELRSGLPPAEHSDEIAEPHVHV